MLRRTTPQNFLLYRRHYTGNMHPIHGEHLRTHGSHNGPRIIFSLHIIYYMCVCVEGQA